MRQPTEYEINKDGFTFAAPALRCTPGVFNEQPADRPEEQKEQNVGDINDPSTWSI